MRTEFFGLKEDPFKMMFDPAYMFKGHHQEEALAHLRYALDEGEGFAVITGERGIGKSTLCRYFAEGLGANVKTAYLAGQLATAVDLLQRMNQQFGVEAQGKTAKDLIDALNEFLLQQRAAGRKVVVFVDDAQTLAAEVLEQVRLISNLETTRDKLIQIVLIGEPELMDQLASRALRQMGQRVSVGYTIGRLTGAETAAYLQHRLSRASIGPPLQFESTVVQALFKTSAGNPRRINLSGAALLSAAFNAGRRTIDKKFAQSVLRDRERDEQPSASQGGTSRHWRGIFCVVGLMAVCSAGLFFLRSSQQPPPELGMEHPGGDLAATAAPPDAPAPIEAAPDFQAPAVAAVEALPSPEESSSIPPRERETRLTHSVQVGAFLQPENARQMMARMTAKGYPARMVKITDSKGRTWLTVRIGDHPNRHAAQAHAEDFIRREQMEAVVQPFGE